MLLYKHQTNCSPPGYPIAISAGTAISGAPVEVVAPWISKIALLVLPLAVFLSFRSVVGTYGAVSLAILSVFSPSVIYFGQYALTDVLSLTLVVTSFGFTLVAWSPGKVSHALLFAFCGGLVAGFSYLTRNANVALLLAAFVSMGVLFFVSPTFEKSRTWKISLSWVVGASIVVLPWLARNLMVFGKIQPYEMSPSTVSAWSNLRTFIGAQISEVLGSSYLGTLVGWSIPGLVMLLILTLAIVRLSFKHWSKLQNGEQRAFVFSLLYALLGAAVVIVARTRYEWGEQISERHTLQYAIFLLLPLTILLRRLTSNKVMLITLSSTIVLVLVTLRLVSVADGVSKENDAGFRTTIGKLIDKSNMEKSGPCARDKKTLVVSNYAYLYRILCDANSLHPGGGGMGGQSIAEAAALIQSRAGDRSVIVALHPGRGIESSNMPLRDHDVEALTSQGWTIRDNSPLALVMAYDRQVSPKPVSEINSH